MVYFYQYFFSPAIVSFNLAKTHSQICELGYHKKLSRYVCYESSGPAYHVKTTRKLIHHI
ncbi:hypothetical protein RchiOBHm_Chr3g0464141 [Rosa chinensis]|uniref:Uncharacterized protein n=1 Tax=Rosa chinensis TaxID=74649 RepID=A0A2P6R9E0_ROSCH|nr:hypothetical protein RchiOBHm_Chr3g0464141 [Rosa chinensis]